ncbi:MAG: hypothetical protein ACYC0F_18770 [Rhodanobacter sp.]
MKTYKVKIEGVFLKLTLEEDKTLCGVISVQIVAANNASGAVTRARLLVLDQLAGRKVDTISDGLLKSFGFISGVWELEEHTKSPSHDDPGLVFYEIGRLKIPWLLMEKLYYIFKKPHLLLSF